MRHSCLLLALVASAAATDNAALRRQTEKNVNLDSREPAEASRLLDARRIPVAIDRTGKVVLRSRQFQRDDDDDDAAEEWRKKHEEELEQMQEMQENNGLPSNAQKDDKEDDDDDNNGNNGDNSGPPGGVIAGGIVGGLIALLLLLTLWYCLRIRPKRKQRQLEAARKQEELEKGFGGSSPSIHPPPQEGTVSPADSPESNHIQWAPTPFPRRAPSVQTGSSISGLALPTPALTYSPSIATATTANTPNLPPTHSHALPSDKPPAYAAVLALQSSEPQPEASAYQMGQVPIPIEPPVYQLPSEPMVGATDIKGEPVSRY
ncbi:hypothetical protein F4821DRAFT_37336 [Hypoxylon rubiginosum]|uniref:Uncharacterized protein n=1 Tax=Hypoxylon rubiginosum TaxID=110542 RepID=A0ACC0DCN2_9PEZI|nr:hypothetical protein F4821DRAFT_37336 [Hypoxylon rubiginosum]